MVGGREMMELIFVRFAVWKEGKGDDDDDVPLASYCVSLSSLEQGEWRFDVSLVMVLTKL